MPMFVHLAPESRLASIRRGGLRPVRRRGGVFAMPVTPDFYVSHQWLRELKRRNAGPIAAVYFRIPDEQPVHVGRYNAEHLEMSSAQAAGELFSEENREGWEIIIPRRIEAKEIHRTQSLPQVVGWRYHPGAHGRTPCPCRFCSGGNYGARRLRERSGWSEF